MRISNRMLQLAVCGALSIGFVAPGTTLAAGPAKSSPGSAALATCMEHAGGVDPRMVECNGAELGRQDVRLNGVYRPLAAKLDPDRRGLLIKAERAWLAARDADCAFAAAGESGGSLYRLLVQDCMISANALRIKALEGYLSSER